MRTIKDLLRDGGEPSPQDVGRIMARAAGLLRFGHDQGAVHGDLTADALLVEQRDGDWAVELDQPRQGAATGATAADDVLGLGRVLELLVRDIPRDRLPDLFPAALASMTAADPAARPLAAQVEQYFAQDFPDGLPVDHGSGPTMPVPVPVSPPAHVADATGAVDDWAPSQHGTAYPDEDLLPLAPQDLSEERRGRGAAVLVSVFVLLLGLGGLGFVVWRTLGVDDEQVASADTRPTDEEPAQEEAGPDPGLDEAASAEEERTEGATVEATGERRQLTENATEEESTATRSARPDVPVPSSPTGSAPRTSGSAQDHSDPDWEGRGWDVRALDEAYCRDGSHFVGLADTETYRGVICGHASGYSYRGLNKSANATLHSSAEPLGAGWQALGDGGVRYEFDEDTFAIYDGEGSVLDEEDVRTWLTPGDTPFRPGDLSISEPITYPACDGSAVVVLGSWQSGGVVDQLVQDALDDNPGSYYVRTDLACDNFNRPSPDLSEMNYIYSVLQPVGYDHGLACDAIEEAATYGYWLQEGVDPGIHIDCD